MLQNYLVLREYLRMSAVVDYQWHSFSRFAKQKTNDDKIIDWMFDRKTILRSFASDKEFCEEYYAMTDFIWPAGWNDEVRF